ncbi:protein-methionine-sulfoxide reductase heme-binding subunit MsrQ [Azospirillum fermentarium]|uniref:sulfite oxidase heme-binding subunit YedZ n=1 Tax=Azospirillum fermentarium TaxID=1233114 RepID=UPI002226B2BC|nr:protein-methionine-sulfoxide reductase heme-binding subunit MsrQ [Azospirillum fermentarium]
MGRASVKTAATAALASPWAKPVLFVAALVPLAWTVWLALSDGLGPEPVAEAVRQSGLWAIRFLMLALAVTPLRIVTGLAILGRFRRMVGLFAFFYAVVHLLTYVGIDQFFDWTAVGLDIVKRPYITIGMGGFVILLLLALTSTAGMVRRLGGRRWRALHKGVFVAGAAGCAHYVMLVKGWQPAPFLYVAILALLVGVRLAHGGMPARRARGGKAALT